MAFLKLLHGAADTWADAAGRRPSRIDVELPTVKAFGEPLRGGVGGRGRRRLIDTAPGACAAEGRRRSTPTGRRTWPALEGVDLADAAAQAR